MAAEEWTALVSGLGLLVGVASAIIALLTWRRTHAMQQSANKAAHTADFLALLSTNDILANANFTLAKLRDDEIPVESAISDSAVHRDVMCLLNYYEYISSFYFRGILDQGLVQNLRGHAMQRVYNQCKSYVAQRRARLKTPLYEDLERFADSVD